MEIKVILVTSNRNELLKDCLNSFNSAPKTYNYHLNIAINGKSAQTKELIKKICPNSTIIQISKATTPAQARNIILNQQSSHEYIFFCDDDVIFPKDYFKCAEEILKKKNDIFGGPDRIAKKAKHLEFLFGLTIQSPLASAHTRTRHFSKDGKKKGYESNLTLCNLWIRSNIFNETNLKFDKRFFRNEENILLTQLEQRNYSLSYISNLFIFHRRRNNFINFFSSIFKSGFFRLMSFRYYPKTFSLIYCIPLIILIIIIIIILFKKIYILFFLAFIYILLNIFFSISTAKKNKSLKYFPLISILTLLINFFYALGEITALLQIFLGRNIKYRNYKD